MDQRIQKFEYLVKGLLDWYKEYHQVNDDEIFEENDMSKLKILKLLFFVCAVKPDLLGTFNNFCALPFGPVESYIYENLNSLTYFKIDKEKTSKLDNDFVGPEFEECDAAITLLKEKNSKLISYTPYQLVDLSHKWRCWINAFDSAYRSGRLSYPITSDAIKNDIPYYKL